MRIHLGIKRHVLLINSLELATIHASLGWSKEHHERAREIWDHIDRALGGCRSGKRKRERPET